MEKGCGHYFITVGQETLQLNLVTVLSKTKDTLLLGDIWLVILCRLPFDVIHSTKTIYFTVVLDRKANKPRAEGGCIKDKWHVSAAV